VIGGVLGSGAGLAGAAVGVGRGEVVSTGGVGLVVAGGAVAGDALTVGVGFADGAGGAGVVLGEGRTLAEGVGEVWGLAVAAALLPGRGVWTAAG
jgi:hypothetical protein